MPALDLFDEARLMAHEVERARRAERLGLGKLHARRSTASAVLEGAEERLDELPVGQPVCRDRLRLKSTEIWCEKRVRHLHLAHRLRHHLLLDCLVDRLRLSRDDQLIRAQRDAGGNQQITPHRFRRRRHRGVLSQHDDQRGVARGRLCENSGEAVETLLLVGALGVGERRIGLDSRTLFAQQKRSHLEARTIGRLQRPLLHCGLNLASGPCEHGDDSTIVGGAIAAS